jgi:pimeloyl-ACP methyl ester carboxylesterase
VSETDKRRAPVPGGEVAFLDAGDPEAPAVVLLSGGFTSSFVWRRLVPLLAPWMRVVAPDLLGSGDSTAAAHADLGLAGHARSVGALLASLGIRRFAVAGHGHGGGVAQLVALDHGAEALVLVDSIAFDAWPAAAVRDLQTRPSVEPTFAEPWMRRLLDVGTVRERLGDDEIEEYLRPFRDAEGAERFLRVASSFDGAGLVDVEPRLAALEIPALVLWGEEDAVLAPELAERLGDALPQSTVALLPGCGHFLLEDAPETVAPLIFQWLRSRYLKVEHRHEEGPVTVYLGRRPPGEGG